jgi:hypothetical protein
MKRLKAKQVFRCVLVLLPLCMAVSSSVFKVGSSKASATIQLDVKARSLLPKLPITSIKQIGSRTFEATYRSDYEKDITAVVFSASPLRFIRRDYIVAEQDKDQKLRSGASDNLLHTVDPLSGDVVITGALFSDGTIEGDKAEIKELLEERRGMKIQFARFNPRLQSLGAADPSTMMKELNGIKEFAASLPIATDDGSPVSEDLEHGLRTAQNSILNSLSKLEGELLNDKVDKFYSRDGTALSVTRDQRVRETFTAIEKDLKGLEHRL